ncbi:hypothetical protein I5F71_02750 [Pseudomonas aeruginosa]|nr:hypothetical protein [Pseudomonas aeruginosa]MBG4718166.1 hypothetical protein [Pseudomonas aeruginosa]
MAGEQLRAGASLRRQKPRRGSDAEASNVINLGTNHAMNAIATAPESNLDASTPEELFAVPFATPLNLDVLQTITSRSLALLGLIQGSGSSGSFPSHKQTMDALWLLEGQLNQLRQVLRSAETAL